MISCIYTITNKINKKFYIGKTNNFFYRMSKHKYTFHFMIETDGVGASIILRKKENEIIFNLDCKSILFTICVAKDYFSKCGYLSSPGGIHIECDNIDKVLSELQNNIIKPDEYDYTIPQVRLLTHKLDPKYVNVFIFPAMEYSKYFKAIELVKHNLISYFKL